MSMLFFWLWKICGRNKYNTGHPIAVKPKWRTMDLGRKYCCSICNTPWRTIWLKLTWTHWNNQLLRSNKTPFLHNFFQCRLPVWKYYGATNTTARLVRGLRSFFNRLRRHHLGEGLITLSEHSTMLLYNMVWTSVYDMDKLQNCRPEFVITVSVLHIFFSSIPSEIIIG